MLAGASLFESRPGVVSPAVESKNAGSTNAGPEAGPNGLSADSEATPQNSSHALRLAADIGTVKGIRDVYSLVAKEMRAAAGVGLKTAA